MRPPTSRKPNLGKLYEADETAWLELSAVLIDKRRFRELDFENLKEFLQAMAERDKREVRSRLLQLILHFLKWQFQPKRRTRSWKNSILNQREELQELLTAKSLADHAEEKLADAYAKAVRRVVRETSLNPSVFPENCPYSLDFLLGEEFPS
jgi:hypothetical protein